MTTPEPKKYSIIMVREGEHYYIEEHVNPVQIMQTNALTFAEIVDDGTAPWTITLWTRDIECIERHEDPDYGAERAWYKVTTHRW